MVINPFQKTVSIFSVLFNAATIVNDMFVVWSKNKLVSSDIQFDIGKLLMTADDEPVSGTQNCKSLESWINGM